MGKDPSLLSTLRGSLWKTPSVADQPLIHLVRWRVLEVRNRNLEFERHFVGFNVDDCEGRASTAIERFDPAARKGETRSGRIYELVGPPGYDTDAAWVWNIWSRLNQMTDERDVTEEVWAIVQANNIC